MLADAVSPDHQVYRDIPAVLEDAHQLSQVILEILREFLVANFLSKCHPHRQLTRKSLLCETVALRQGVEELDHTLFLVQRGVSLERLLDEATQLFGLMNE